MIVAAAVLALSSCASYDAVVEPPVPDGDSPRSWDVRAFVAVNGQDGEARDACLRAAAAVAAGDADEAERELRTAMDAGEGAWSEEARSALLALLFDRCRWDDILALDGDPGSSFVAIAAALAGAPRETLAFPRGTATLPIRLSLSGCPMVRARVNGVERWFWMDTGAAFSTVSGSLALEAGMGGTAAGDISTATSAHVGAGIATASLELGPAIFVDHPFFVLSDRDLTILSIGPVPILKVDGIIGWNAIKRLDVHIDYARRTVTVGEPVPGPRGQPVLFWYGYPLVKAHGAGIEPLLFGLDTGARLTTLRHGLLDRLGLEYSASTVWVGGAGGGELMESREVDRFSFSVAARTVTLRKATSQPDRPVAVLRVDGVIGSDVFRRTTLRLDASNGVFEIGR